MLTFERLLYCKLVILTRYMHVVYMYLITAESGGASEHFTV